MSTRCFHPNSLFIVSNPVEKVSSGTWSLVQLLFWLHIQIGVYVGKNRLLFFTVTERDLFNPTVGADCLYID